MSTSLSLLGALRTRYSLSSSLAVQETLALTSRLTVCTGGPLHLLYSSLSNLLLPSLLPHSLNKGAIQLSVGLTLTLGTELSKLVFKFKTVQLGSRKRMQFDNHEN